MALCEGTSWRTVDGVFGRLSRFALIMIVCWQECGWGKEWRTTDPHSPTFTCSLSHRRPKKTSFTYSVLTSHRHSTSALHPYETSRTSRWRGWATWCTQCKDASHGTSSSVACQEDKIPAWPDRIHEQMNQQLLLRSAMLAVQLNSSLMGNRQICNAKTPL